MLKNELALEIINDGVFPMCMPLLKLKAMSAVLSYAGDSKNELSADEMRGVAEILRDISFDFQDAYDESHEIAERGEKAAEGQEAAVH